MAEKYLISRGLSLTLPGTLRYHPGLWHSPSKQQLPCMVAAITKWPNKDYFSFSGLVTCGHCHCSLVGEIKKEKYIYYYCSGHKGKCPEPYVREEVLEKHFSDVIKKLHFPQEVLSWVKDALLCSNEDTQRFHQEAIVKLQAEYQKLESRIQTMYVDKLDRRILGDFFDSMSTKWRAEQSEILQAIQTHQNANQNYIVEGVKLLELAQNAYKLFVQQDPMQKRRLLNFLVSNSYWADKTGGIEETL